MLLKRGREAPAEIGEMAEDVYAEARAELGEAAEPAAEARSQTRRPTTANPRPVIRGATTAAQAQRGSTRG
jgi:hypothetical protein